MPYLDIIIGGLLLYSAFKGMQNGLFKEFASFVSVYLGIYFAIKFSSDIKEFLAKFIKWNTYAVQIMAFVLILIATIIIISLIARMLTKLIDFAYLGWVNKIGGSFFRVLKTGLFLSLFFNFLVKINYNYFLIRKETLNQSVFYSPITKIADTIFLSGNQLYDKTKIDYPFK